MELFVVLWGARCGWQLLQHFFESGNKIPLLVFGHFDRVVGGVLVTCEIQDFFSVLEQTNESVTLFWIVWIG